MTEKLPTSPAQAEFNTFIASHFAFEETPSLEYRRDGVRLNLWVPRSQFNHLQGLSIVDELTLGVEMRTALAYYIKRRRESPDFESQIAEARERTAPLLAPLPDNSDYSI